MCYIVLKKFYYKGKLKKVGNKVNGISKEDIEKLLNIGWIKKVDN